MVNTTRRRSRGNPLLSTATLALWRVRRTWGMLCFTGLGMLAAVMLVCSVPLYSRVATTAGLRNVLHTTRDSSTLTLHANVGGISSDSVSELQNMVNGYAQDTIAPYTTGAPQFSIQTQQMNLLSPFLGGGSDSIGLFGASMSGVAQHVKLVAGRLPAESSKTLEVAMTPESAKGMNVHIGSTIVIQLTGYIPANGIAVDTLTLGEKFSLHLVGLIEADIANDVFWHGFHLYSLTVPATRPPIVQFGVLTSNTALLQQVDAFVAASRNLFTDIPAAVYNSQISELYWYYQLNTATLDINQLNDLITGINQWNNTATNQLTVSQGVFGQQTNTTLPFVQNISVTGEAVPIPQAQSTLQLYQARVGVANIPVSILLLQVTGLILFFIALMSELLVERQTETIAVLGSRGANKPQIIGAFVTQSLVLALIALLLGPSLALLLVAFMARLTLPASEVNALNVLWRNPLDALLSVRGYALGAMLVAMAAMIFATYRAVGFNILSVRREAARTRSRPLWQRLHLDIVAAVVALAGYLISIYLNSMELGSQTRVLVQSPLAILAPTFLLLAGVLLVLRIFPALLRVSANMATRGRGAAAMLALGQMSRSPRQSLRMTLLLALTTAFAIFALVFSASQAQRITDLTNYQVGADFSGILPSTDASFPFEQENAVVNHISGVTSATLGFGSAATSGASSFQLQLRAVDANTFGKTAIWTTQDSSQPLGSLMQQLIARRAQVTQNGLLPALVDSTTWKQLHLTPGAHFQLSVNNPSDTGSGIITCIALAEVQRIPTTNNGGILLDYQSYASVYQKMFGIYLAVNYLWVHTSDNPALVQHVRDVLTSQQPIINPLQDRRALVAQFGKDPLYLDLVGVLALGASTALLLALLGNLLVSWLSARNRQTSFAVLRALGTSTEQVAGVLSWEQGITYLTSLLLGIGFGVLLSATVIPALVFSGAPSNDTTNAQFYSSQYAIPVRLIVPLSLVLALSVLVILCIIALGMMIRVVTQPALGQMLRLNED